MQKEIEISQNELKRPRLIHSKKCIRVDETQNSYHDDKVKYAEDCHQTWYNDEDYDRFLANHRAIILKAQKIIQQHQASVTPDYSFSELLDSLVQFSAGIDYSVDEASTLLSSYGKQQLTMLYKKGYEEEEEDERMDWIGLEFYLSHYAARESRRRRAGIQEAVCDIQKQCRNGLWKTFDASEEELKESCYAFSQAFCLFAQYIAQAQLMDF